MSMPTTEIKIQQKQTVLDVALQHYGSVEGMRYLLQDSLWLNWVFPSVGAATKTLMVREPINIELVQYYNSKDIVPASMQEYTPLTTYWQTNYSEPGYVE